MPWPNASLTVCVDHLLAAASCDRILWSLPLRRSAPPVFAERSSPLAALGDVAKARCMARIANDAGLGRESLYKAPVPILAMKP